MAARSTQSWWRKTCSQTSRPQMRTAQNAKKQRMLSTRMRLMGVTMPVRDTEEGIGGVVEGFFTGRRAPLPKEVQQLTNSRQQGLGLSQCRRIGIGGGVGTNNLAGMRGCEAELACHLVDACRVSELRFGEAKLAVLFLELLDLLLLRLDAVSVLDGAEMLPAVHHNESEEQGHGAGEGAHLLDALRVGGLDEARVVETLDEEDLGRGATARALLRGQKRRIALHDPVVAAAACFQTRLRCDCLCRHGVSPEIQLIAIRD